MNLADSTLPPPPKPPRRRLVAPIIFGVVMAAAGLLLGYWFFWRSAPVAQAPIEPPITLNPSATGGIETTPVTPPTETPAPTEPPAPPPPVAISGRTAQGLRRVEFNPFIGDIFRIQYDQPSGALIMAVVEPDGLRSIWRLTKDSQISRVLQENNRPGEIFLGSDSNGILYAGFADPGTLYRSTDAGLTWLKVRDGIDGAFWSVADDGRGTLWGTLHAYNKAWLYRSTDNGVTWEVWLDFQKLYPEYAKTYREGDDRFALRHLHSVAYADGKLFVGVGDVARFTVMSEDGGETWRQIWSEGFTAWTPIRDNSGLILGPDRLQTHGLAYYDFASGKTTEVWSPIPYGYAGYTYSLTNVEGSYFAAFHTETNEVETFAGKSGIIVSPDGRTWFPFLEFDPLSNWARTDIFMSPAERWAGYVTLNGALYLFEPPIGRWYEVHQPFGAKK